MIYSKAIRLSIFIVAFFTVVIAQCQDYYVNFQKLLADSDTLAERKLLEEWNKKKGKDPELYVSYFNYYVQKSRSEVVLTSMDRPEGKSLEITDSTGQVVGYMYSENTYDEKYLKLGFQTIDKGISKYPDRLDMRFGKIFMLGKALSYDAFADEIVKTVNYSAKIKHKWKWAKNEDVEDPRDFLLDNIQTYVNVLFDAGNEQATNIRKIAEASLQYFPDHVISVSNLAVSYLFEENYEKGLETLLKAEKLAPQDCIILGNIAYVYRTTGNDNGAIEYYSKMVQFGDDETKAFAEEQLKELKK